MFGVFILSIVLLGILIGLMQEKRRHDKRLRNLKVRVHVNGIRGKSTVTRLIAGMLREAGLQTMGKTTGSAARVILPDASEVEIRRQGAPTIVEILNIIRDYTDSETEAVVIETMALHPRNQASSQDLLVKGNFTVITNIREDHMDVMGQSLMDITDTLSMTIPENGVVITSEVNQEIRDRIEENARNRGSVMIYADPTLVKDTDLLGFSYLTFKENLAIGLTLADLLGIPRSTAMRGMRNARPDIGVTQVQTAYWQDKKVIWAPLFAVNDRESVIINLQALDRFYPPEATRIGILNNRYDRADRAMRFAEIAAKDIYMDHWITFGAYEDQVTTKMIELGIPREQITNLGFSVNPSLEEIQQQVVDKIEGEIGILVGMVNIHTPQAEQLLEYFAEQPDAGVFWHDEEAQIHYRQRSEVEKERLLARLGRPGPSDV